MARGWGGYLSVSGLGFRVLGLLGKHKVNLRPLSMEATTGCPRDPDSPMV